ncbi:unnamed protein product [Mytilus edulis]|uniref:MYND-type domain-containing protein n=1 Tax=Mytilus edulis TaxID=6550 RepID=A0A8S3UIV7_MYTED|nr:unnamed protein product [Mytilus edulis]
MLLTDRPFTTLMLRKGYYKIREPLFITKSIQVIGVEEGVEIDTKHVLNICRLPKFTFSVDIDPEKDIQVHFENINFVDGGGQINVSDNSVATFYKCNFSNGQKGCASFPKCKGDKGCINQLNCKLDFQLSLSESFDNKSIGEVGFAGICVSVGGTAYVDMCVFDRCGGGGVLSCGKTAFLEIRNCTICNMRQMGIEAREGGEIIAINNLISGNQFHGVVIGPNRYGNISGNTIQGNGAEGIWCGGILDGHGKIKMSEECASRAILNDNIIRQNGLSGISLDGGYFEVKGNRIFSNWLWGMMVKSRSYSYILGNDISENKCGGIRIGHNYTAAVFIDGNTIRDHIGPGIYLMKSIDNLLKKSENKFFKVPVGNGEIFGESRKPFIYSTNLIEDNERGIQHPKHTFPLIEAYCFCRNISQHLKSCSRCKKANYCSKECQKTHWIKHKHICKLLHESYVVEIKMCDTKPNKSGGPPEDREAYTINLMSFSNKLVGIGNGSPPDKNSSKRFIVKILSGREYGYYDPYKNLMVYDQTVTFDILLSNPKLYHLCNECGVLAGEKLTVKKIFCWASFKNNGKIICFHTDNLPPLQTW